MNKFFIAVTGSATMLAMISGCYYTEIASPASSPEMQEWEKVIMESYPGYTPPKMTSKNYKGHTETRYSSVPAKLTPMDDPVDDTKKNNVDQQPAADPVMIQIEEPEKKAEEPAAKDPAVEEVKAEEPAVEEVKEEEKKAETPAAEEVKEEEKKAEEVKAETPAAEEKKAEEVKAETPAAEEKKAEEVKEEEKKAETPAAEEKKAEEDNMPPDPTNSTVYEVQPGDSLSAIAYKVYGNARFSNVIFKANADILKDPNKLRPGMKLIIPKL